MSSHDPASHFRPPFSSGSGAAAAVYVLRRAAWTGIAGWPLFTGALWMASTRAAGLYALGIHLLAAYGVFRANCGLYGPVVKRFATAEQEVWLTIDDGPFARDTEDMLAVLARHGARATFFLEGARARQTPELVRAISAAGHTVGNHSHHHRVGWFWCAGPQTARQEIAACNAALAAAGAVPVGFRAPVGMANLFVHRAAQAAGLPVLGWSARGFDGLDRDPQRVVGRLLPKIRPGAILLLHQRPGREAGEGGNAPILAALLDALKARGYRCVLPSPNQFLSL